MAAEPELIIRFKGDTKDLESQIDKLKTSLASLEPAADKATKGNKKLEDSNNSLKNSVGNLLKGYLSYQAALAAGKYILNATLEVSKFETQLNTASGSQEKFGQNMAFLEDLANTYKKNVVDLGASFSQLTIATKGTNLEGAETEKLFKAVTIASSALKMSTDDTTGTFRAFIQMVSKGNVQAEELRGQLGERLYGAFNLAAKAAGQTTAELNKSLQAGTVLASDLLPKLSNELINTFSKDALSGANTLGSNIDYASGQLTLFVAELAKTTGLESTINTLVSNFGSLLTTLRELNKESSIGKGFFDRMFTLPGNSLSSGNSGKRETQQEFYARLSRELRGEGQGKSFSKDQSNTSTNDYAKQFDIRDTNPGLEAKILAQREAALRKRQAAQNKIDAEANRDAKDALDAKLAESASNIEASYRQYNGIIQDVIGETSKTGLSSIFDSASYDKIGEQFTKDVTGDGKLKKAFENLGASISTTKGLFTKDENDLNNNIDGALGELESSLIMRYGSLAEATRKGMGRFVEATKRGGQTYQDTIDNLREYDGIQQLNQSITGALRDAAADTAIAFGEMIGSALAGGDGFENAGKAFGLVLANMLSTIGKALVTFATLILIAETSIFEAPVVALAAGIAAVAAGAYLKSKIGDAKSQGLYTGGFVQGPGGTDNIPTRLTAGELVLNKRQQANMFGLINGTNTGRNFNRNFGNSGRDSAFVGQLTTTIRSGDLAVAVNIGQKKNNKFR